MVVQLGGILAGAATAGEGRAPWAEPAIPVDPPINLGIALCLFYGGLVLLVRSWVQLRRWVLSQAEGSARPTLITIALVVLVWAIPFLAGPPLGSRDVYAYAAQGRMAEVGLDVYSGGPGQLGNDPVLAAMDPIYLDAPVVYGPAFVEITSLISKLTSGPVGSVMAFRLLGVVGLLAASAGVWDLARGLGRDPADAIVLTLANPLVLLHLVSGAHNEAIMLGLLVGGVAVGTRPNWRWLGIALCAVGALVKIPAILGVAYIAWPWILAAKSTSTRAYRLLLSAAIPVVVMVATARITGWGWGWGWITAMRDAEPVDAYLSVTRVFGGALNIVTGVSLGPILDVVRPLGLLVAGIWTFYLLTLGKQPTPVALGWSLLVFAVLHPTTQPWYLTWGLLLIAAGTAGSRNRAFVVLSAFSAFVVLPVGPQLGQTLLDAGGGGAIALIMAALVLLTLSPTPAGHTPLARRLDPDLVSIIVPTRNESLNIGPMVIRVTELVAAAGLERCELIFVDDSDDETPAVIGEFASEHSAHQGSANPIVRLCQRQDGGRWGGLGGAVVDGFAEARGAIAVVIDGDLQHPPEEIPALVHEVRSGSDLVVASRRVAGGSAGAGLTPARDWLSRCAAAFSRTLFPKRVGRIADPLSGFFAVRLDRIDPARLHPDGFKILVEVLATHPELSTSEIAFTFVDREEGESKASVGQGLRFVSHVLDLRLRTSRPWAGSVGPQRVFRSV